jgi:hypothetical protein
MIPSCWRAPPEAEQMIKGRRSRRATSAARAIFSPTTEPIEAPMNEKSMIASITGSPSSRPRP